MRSYLYVTCTAQPAYLQTTSPLGSLGLGPTRVSCGSISKRFLCWNCICNSAFSQLLLGWIRPLRFYQALHALQGSHCVFLFSSLPYQILANTGPVASPLSQYQYLEIQKSIVRNFDTSNNRWISTKGSAKPFSVKDMS